MNRIHTYAGLIGVALIWTLALLALYALVHDTTDQRTPDTHLQGEEA